MNETVRNLNGLTLSYKLNCDFFNKDVDIGYFVLTPCFMY